MPSSMGPIIEEAILAEGGLLTWTNRHGDSGGETVGGVSRVHHPKLAWWKDVGTIKNAYHTHFQLQGGRAVDLGQFSIPEVGRIRDGVLAFYHKQGQLTRSVHCTEIESQAVASALYSAKINGGPGMLRRVMQGYPSVGAPGVQGVIGVERDGGLGPKTLAALNAYGEPHPDLDDETAVYHEELLEGQILTSITQAMVIRYARIVQGKVRKELERAHERDANYRITSDSHRAYRVKDSYDKTDAGNLVGWAGNRAWKGLI